MTRIILLVEDNRIDEKLTLQAFKRSGVASEVVIARDGRAALDYVFATGLHTDRTAQQLPSLVLLDLKLSRIKGLEVLRRIRADGRTRLLPVVILTSSKEEEDIAHSYSLGANAYIRKPIEFAEFVDVARTLGRFWLDLNEPPPAAATMPRAMVP
jgi:two-component system, response regulator